MANIPYYADPIGESTLKMGIAGAQPFLVSTTAMVSGQLSNAFDTQGSKGANFARVKFVGVNLARFKINWVVYPEEEENFWTNIVPLARQKGKNGNSPAMDVINPQINRAGINRVTIRGFDYETPTAREGRSVSMQLEEWAPAPAAPKADPASTATGTPSVQTSAALSENT